MISKAVMREAIVIQRDEPAMNRAGQILMSKKKNNKNFKICKTSSGPN